MVHKAGQLLGAAGLLPHKQQSHTGHLWISHCLHSWSDLIDTIPKAAAKEKNLEMFIKSHDLYNANSKAKAFRDRSQILLFYS